MNLDEFQSEARRTEFYKIHTSAPEEELKSPYLLFGLMAQVGEIANRLKKKLRDGEDYVLLKSEISERIGYALWYTAMLADELGLSLGEIARQNVRFNERRWHQVTDTPKLIASHDFEANFPDEQHLPQKLIAHFETQLIDGLKKTVVWIYPDWPRRDTAKKFGDAIDDNSSVEDRYRFHDVFHFAYVAVLGWSPVVRKLLECKRKKDGDTDRIEDGARARDTEEPVTAFIYSYVSQQKMLKTSDNIDTSVLTTVRTLLRDFEVNACMEKEWERAILAASAAMRQLIDNDGGWIETDRKNGTIQFLGKNMPS